MEDRGRPGGDICFVCGIYSEFDSDAYYGEDILTRWIYGAFLILSAYTGIGVLLGITGSTLVLLLGWVYGCKLEGISMTFKRALLGGCDYIDSLLGALFSSIFLFYYIIWVTFY